MRSFGEQVKARGWRTGRVVPHALLPSVAEHLTRPGGATADVQAGDWLVVISQTCDVVSSKLESEPYVEILHCRPIKKTRSQFRNLKSTRTLDFLANRTTHPHLALSAHALADRYLLPRQVLHDNDPEPSRHLDDIAVQRILAWYTLRTSRPAWPNNFSDRIRPTVPALERALDPLHEDIAEVRVAIAQRDDELSEGEPYRVAVFFVVDAETWDREPEGRAVVNDAFNGFVTALDACDGIDVDKTNSGVVSGGEFTWQETRLTDEWNFANLSYRD